MKVCASRALPDPVVNSHIHSTEAFLAVAVLISNVRVACLLRSLDKYLIKRASTEALGHMKRARTAAIVVLSLVIAFRPFEIREAVRV